ncbi:hypothetical protein [Buttiauxella izardii]|uniref:Uncharacterized protein n=1 Tax=Buttiauxella izardii TaxID=82991 RepID=A0A3A5K086_9ENTR|nr:hypothetical protein [Buttiauxella izardii]RJT27913.1 hypothetical protein D6029_00135 [Buttiauxella izardii]
MIKNAFVEKTDEGKIVVRVEEKEVSSFDDYDAALEWAFSIGYRVYKKELTSSDHKECWVKYLPKSHL